MKIFLDANILVSVLNKEYPVFTDAARILSLTDRRGIEICTSPLCLAIAFYFSEKKSGTKLAKKKIDILLEKISICSIDQNMVLNAVSNPAVHDFEDGMEYYAALNFGCDYIVTQDVEDFYFSEIPVYDSEHFITVFLERLFS